MPQHEAAYIGNRFGRAQTSRRERHPGLRTAGRHERITRPHMDERILIHAQVNERVTAEDLDAETRGRRADILGRVVEERNAAGRLEARVDLVTRDRPDAFVALFHIGERGRSSLHEDGGGTRHVRRP